MGLTVRSARRVAPALIITIIIFVTIFLALRQAVGATAVGTIDLLQYYAAAKLWLSGQNPYNPELIESVERSVSSSSAIPVLMWNPPQILPIIAPLALLKFSDAVAAWILLAVLSIAISVKIGLSLFGCDDNRARKILQLALLFSFYPFALCVGYGQISFILLLSLSIFLQRLSRPGRYLTDDYLGGIVLSLIAIKPHLLYLGFILLLVLSLRTRSWKTILGFLSGFVALSLLAIINAPNIYSWYQQAITSAPPIYWQTPTLGSWVQGLTAINQPWIRTLPTILFAGCAVVIFFRLDKRALNTGLFIAIIPLSLVSSPYGWTYDHMLMLPTMLWFIYESKSNLWASALVALNLLVCLTPPELGQQSLVWYPAAVAILALLQIARTNCYVVVAGSSGSSKSI